MFRRLDEKFRDSVVWQFIKFNLMGTVIFWIQVILANLLPFVFDGLAIKLPPFLRGVFRSEVLFDGPSRYVIDGVVTWGYVLPFFLSNLIANIVAYFLSMKTVFRGKGHRWSFIVYCIVLISLILFSTWLQGLIVSLLARSSFAVLARSIATMAAGLVQVIVLFPLEKYVLFKQEVTL
jgi:hypothetical protein